MIFLYFFHMYLHNYVKRSGPLALLLKNSVELQDFFSSGVLHLTGGGHLETRPESTAKDKVSNIEK